MCNTVAPRNRFTDAVDALDAAITSIEAEQNQAKEKNDDPGIPDGNAGELAAQLRRALFPAPSRGALFNWDSPRTYITVELHQQLGWADRLRTLVSGRLRTTAFIYTDVEVRDADTRAVTWVE